MVKLKHLFIAFALIVLGGGSVQAGTQQKSISVADSNTFNYCSATVSTDKGTGATTITWSSKLENFGYWVNKEITDFSKYTKLVIDVAKDGESNFPTDLQISLNKENATYASDKHKLSEGTNQIEISSLLNSSLDFDNYSAMQSIAFYSSSAGSFIIKSISFEYDDAIPAIVEAPAVAEDKIRYTVDLHKTGRTIALDGSFNVINQCYKSSTYGNNLMLINEFNNSLKSDYKKMYISITKINKAGAARYNDGQTTYLNDGVNEIDLTSVNLEQFQIGGHNGSEMVINYIYLEGPKIENIQGEMKSCLETELTKDIFREYDAEGNDTGSGWGYCTTGESTGLPYGHGSVPYNLYADLAKYDYLELVLKEGPGTPRFLFNRLVDNGTVYGEIKSGVNENFWKVTGNTYLVDLQKVKAEGSNGTGCARLHAIKSVGGNVTVTSMKLLKIREYNLSGKGSLEDVQSVLDEPTLTSVDATGLTNETAIKITTGNPNCLIIANTDKLSNENNVLIKGAGDSYSCASLVLKDANDFAAPVAFNATDAAFTRDAKGYDGWATVCLPFEATVPTGVKAWEIESVNAGVLNMKSITTIPANKAVLLQFDEATGLAVSASSATVSKTVAASGSEKTELVGVYAKQQAPVGSYVLQKKGDGVLAFYQVAEGSQPNIPAFRAYLTVAPGETAKGNVMRINFEETTGISDMQNNETILTPAMKYNMAGQSVKHMKKGVQIQRMSDGSVRKVMVK